MRDLMRIGLVGFCVFLITGAVGAEGASPAKRCTGWEEGKGHCKRKGASCDNHELETRNLCEAGNIIQVSDVGESAALNLLRRDYLLLPIGENPSEHFPTHVVIAPQDLDDPGTIAVLREAHQVGKTVAIVGATQDEARIFHRLLRPGQEVNCAPQPGQTWIPLYGLQQSVTRVPGQHSSYCLVNLDRHRGNRKADRRWLKDRFAATPPQPSAGQANETSDPTTSLTDLSGATHCSAKFSQEISGVEIGSLETDLFTYTMRNFTDSGCSSCSTVGADYYLVQETAQFVQYAPSQNPVSYILSSPTPNEVSSGLPINVQLIGLEYADPQTVTTTETSYTSDSSTTVSGSVGLDSDGPNVTFGGSTTTGNSTTYTVPPLTILNQSSVTTAKPSWTFVPNPSPPLNTLVLFTTTWLWFIPQDAYPSGGTGNGQITFDAVSQVFTMPSSGIGSFLGPYTVPCSVNYPFSTWTVEPPKVWTLVPTTTSRNGGQFTITGEFLYPGSVTAVLIGGQQINLGTNVDLVNDTTINVTVGSLNLTPGTYPVQVNTQFNSENRFSNTLELELTN